MKKRRVNCIGYYISLEFTAGNKALEYFRATYTNKPLSCEKLKEGLFLIKFEEKRGV